MYCTLSSLNKEMNQYHYDRLFFIFFYTLLDGLENIKNYETKYHLIGNREEF